jgi:hypothetical protein
VVALVVDAAAGGTISVGAGVEVAAGVVTVAVVTVAVAGSTAAGALAAVVGVAVAAAARGVVPVAVAGSAAAGAPALPLGVRVAAGEVTVAVAGSDAVETLEAAVAQWSAITFTEVTARVLSVAPNPGALTLFPVNSTSWPR